MDVTKSFLHKVLLETAPSLTVTGRDKVIDEVIDHMINHPWVDDELRSSMLLNLANSLNIELPKELHGSGLLDVATSLSLEIDKEE